MIINMSGGGIDNLKFRVYAATSLPASGKENDVCIITSTPISWWEVYPQVPTWEPGTGNGHVYIQNAPAYSGEYPNVNILKKKGFIWLYLVKCWQYENGNWSSKDAYQYRNGTWVQFSTTNQIPDFTYTGDYEIVNDSDEPITVSQDNWKIRFLTSGTLTFTTLNGAENGIDVFLVGGGGGAFFPDSGWQPGAAGGYTTVQESVMLEKNLSYQVSIGAGGTAGTSSAKAGGKTTAFGFTANGAEISGNNTVGGGSKPEFHDSSLENKYAGYGANGTEPVAYGTGGGGDCAKNDGANGTPPTPSNAANTHGKPNTGGGGGGSVNGWRGGNGGSGIVIIRNAREVS